MSARNVLKKTPSFVLISHTCAIPFPFLQRPLLLFSSTRCLLPGASEAAATQKAFSSPGALNQRLLLYTLYTDFVWAGAMAATAVARSTVPSTHIGNSSLALARDDSPVATQWAGATPTMRSRTGSASSLAAMSPGTPSGGGIWKWRGEEMSHSQRNSNKQGGVSSRLAEGLLLANKMLTEIPLYGDSEEDAVLFEETQRENRPPSPAQEERPLGASVEAAVAAARSRRANLYSPVNALQEQQQQLRADSPVLFLRQLQGPYTLPALQTETVFGSTPTTSLVSSLLLPPKTPPTPIPFSSKQEQQLPQQQQQQQQQQQFVLSLPASLDSHVGLGLSGSESEFDDGFVASFEQRVRSFLPITAASKSASARGSGRGDGSGSGSSRQLAALDVTPSSTPRVRSELNLTTDEGDTVELFELDIN